MFLSLSFSLPSALSKTQNKKNNNFKTSSGVQSFFPLLFPPRDGVWVKTGFRDLMVAGRGGVRPMCCPLSHCRLAPCVLLAVTVDTCHLFSQLGPYLSSCCHYRLSVVSPAHASSLLSFLPSFLHLSLSPICLLPPLVFIEPLLCARHTASVNNTMTPASLELLKRDLSLEKQKELTGPTQR